MGSILKKFGLGILYIFVLPIYLVAVLIFGIYGIGLFLVLMIKSIICFFKGQSLHGDLPEDIEAKRILHPESVQPKSTPIIEEREETVVVAREDEVHPRAIEEERPRFIAEEPRREAIEVHEEEPEEDEEFEDIYDEENEDSNVEAATIDDLDIDDEEEEDIPTIEDDSKIFADDDDDSDDDSSSGVSFTDWRGR